MKKSPGSQQAIQKAKAEFAHQIQTHFEEEHGVTIGRFEAEELFDKCLRAVAPAIYNQALSDARDYYQEHLQTISDDIVQLEIDSSKVR